MKKRKESYEDKNISTIILAKFQHNCLGTLFFHNHIAPWKCFDYRLDFFVYVPNNIKK